MGRFAGDPIPTRLKYKSKALPDLAVGQEGSWLCPAARRGISWPQAEPPPRASLPQASAGVRRAQWPLAVNSHKASSGAGADAGAGRRPTAKEENRDDEGLRSPELYDPVGVFIIQF